MNNVVCIFKKSVICTYVCMHIWMVLSMTCLFYNLKWLLIVYVKVCRFKLSSLSWQIAIHHSAQLNTFKIYSYCMHTTRLLSPCVILWQLTSVTFFHAMHFLPLWLFQVWKANQALDAWISLEEIKNVGISIIVFIFFRHVGKAEKVFSSRANVYIS